MKRTLFVVFLAFVATVGLMAASQPATGVTGTFHDLSATGYKTVTNINQICVFCHIPHDASGGVLANMLIPLWNHTTTTSTFTMYNPTNVSVSEIPTTGVTIDSNPTGASLACLSCHDGSLAIGAASIPYGWGTVSYGTYQGGTGPWIDSTTGKILAGSPVFIGTDLTTNHPISITYQDNLAATKLKPATGLALARLFPSNTTGSRVQCASCHDPHNYGTSGANSPFLRGTMAGSALCKDCHSN